MHGLEDGLQNKNLEHEPRPCANCKVSHPFNKKVPYCTRKGHQNAEQGNEDSYAHHFMTAIDRALRDGRMIDSRIKGVIILVTSTITSRTKQTTCRAPAAATTNQAAGTDGATTTAATIPTATKPHGPAAMAAMTINATSKDPKPATETTATDTATETATEDTTETAIESAIGATTRTATTRARTTATEAAAADRAPPNAPPNAAPNDHSLHETTRSGCWPIPSTTAKAMKISKVH